MIIYNVTVSLIDQTIQEDWLHWMKTKHIPDVMNTGCFVKNKICRLMVDDEITYAIQYTCKDLATLEKYHQDFHQHYKQNTPKNTKENLEHFVPYQK